MLSMQNTGTHPLLLFGHKNLTIKLIKIPNAMGEGWLTEVLSFGCLYPNYRVASILKNTLKDFTFVLNETNLAE